MSTHVDFTTTTPEERARQQADEDLAADLRGCGASWEAIADELELAVSVAKAYVSRAHARAAEQLAREQIALF